MMVIKDPVDVEALACEHYPQDWQLAERLAFIKGFLMADPSKAKKDPAGHRRRPGERTDVLRSLEVGEDAQVSFRDSSDWSMWRSTASYFRRLYGARFSIVRDRKARNKLNIHRYE